MQETLVQSLNWEDPLLEKEMETHSSTFFLPGKPDGQRSLPSCKRVRRDLATKQQQCMGSLFPSAG